MRYAMMYLSEAYSIFSWWVTLLSADGRDFFLALKLVLLGVFFSNLGEDR